MIDPTTQWAKIDLKLNVFLKDMPLTQTGEARERSYTQPQRLSAWNWAQRKLAMHTPQEKIVYPTIDADGRSAILPPDLLGIRQIYDADEKRWMRPKPARSTKAGSIRYDDDDLAQFFLWGGKLYFEQEIDASHALTMYFWAYWPEVLYEMDGETLVLTQDKIFTPPWAELALCHLTAATCLIPGAIDAAIQRQYNIRIDSGTPLDNSRAAMAHEHVWWWNYLVDSVPPVDWRNNSGGL